jgi:hypothetical protein
LRSKEEDFEELRAKMAVVVARKAELEKKYLRDVANLKELLQRMRGKEKEREKEKLEEQKRGVRGHRIQKEVVCANCRKAEAGRRRSSEMEEKVNNDSEVLKIRRGVEEGERRQESEEFKATATTGYYSKSKISAMDESGKNKEEHHEAEIKQEGSGHKIASIESLKQHSSQLLERSPGEAERSHDGKESPE